MPEPSFEYRYAGITDVAAALRSRAASAAEIAETATNLLAEIGPRYNAIATVMHERARSEARRAQERLEGRDPDLLCGVPYAVKDLFSARGAPTTWGSAVFADRVIDTDATVVRRLGAQGAVLTAKLAMSEFAGGGRPEKAGASMHGQGRNPWDPLRYSGGSSSGSGIAVALGLVPFALGTETGGSVLGPAAFSGVTGMRPTYGLVPRGGVMTLSWSLDKVGPLARTASDCGAVMEALTGSRISAFAAAVRGVPASERRRVRVAVSHAELDEAAPSIRQALSGGLERFLTLFPNAVDVELRRDPDDIRALEEIVRVEGGWEFRDLLRRPDFAMSDARQQATLASGLEVPVAEYLSAIRTSMRSARRAFDRLFSSCDVVLSASRPSIAPRLDEVRPPRDASKISDLLRAAGNLAGVPGVSFPCGLSDEGMPVGLQLLGPRGSDARLLAMVASFQHETSHHLQRPPDAAASGQVLS